MIRATFTFTNDTGGTGRFEIDARASADVTGPSVRLTYKNANSPDGVLEVVHVGALAGYSPWSEAPLALVLRALFFLRTSWYRQVPTELMEGRVQKMKLSVEFLDGNDRACAPLAALHLSQLPGEYGKYALVQSVPDDVCSTMVLNHWCSFPLATAMKMVELSQPQLTYVELKDYPDALTLSEFIDQAGCRYVMRESVPDYALRAFDARRPLLRLHRDGDRAAPIPATEWQAFLAA